MATVETVKLSKYDRFKDSVGRVAGEWDEEAPLDGKPGGRIISLSVAKNVVEKVMAEPGYPKDWYGPEGAPVPGLRVMSLIVYYASLAAGHQGFDLVELESILRNSDSFQPVALLSRQRNKVAGSIERDFGLDRSEYEDNIAQIEGGNYRIVKGILTIPNLPLEIYGKVSEILTGGEVYDPEGCRAHQVLFDVFQYMVEIHLKDARLATASLNRAIVLSKKHN